MLQLRVHGAVPTVTLTPRAANATAYSSDGSRSDEASAVVQAAVEARNEKLKDLPMDTSANRKVNY